MSFSVFPGFFCLKIIAIITKKAETYQMSTEIELKAHIEDIEVLRLLLLEKAQYAGAFEKDDAYWQPEGNHTSLKGSSSGLRIRKEKRTLPDGQEENLTLATTKEKEVKNGIEVNKEREFEIRPDARYFEDYLSSLGLRSTFSKQKKGWLFSFGELNIELLEVKNLGPFIELEIVTDFTSEDAITKRKEQLLDFLDSIGIKREAIESRFYSEMLAEKK